MIEKILSIKNVGRFKNCCAKGDVAFKKMTLIYGENGKGKTTLCAILRSLQSGKSEFINERKTLGSTDQPNVRLLLDGDKQSKFSQNSWDAICDKIAIFDSTFIHENIYAGDHVEHEHKKNLYRVILGEKGKSLALEVENLDSKIRDANKEIGCAQSNLLEKIPKGYTRESFDKVVQITDVETQILAKMAEIERYNKSAEKANEIALKSALSKVLLPVFPMDFSTLLSEEVVQVAKEAKEKVKTHIKNNLDKKGETWLSQGLSYAKKETCPFCGQSIKGNYLLEIYNSYFNITYTNTINKIEALPGQINATLGDSSLLSIQKEIAANETLITFWKQFFSIDLLAFPFDELQKIFNSLNDRGLSLIQQKLSNPLIALHPDNEFNTALTMFNEFQKKVDCYNQSIESINLKITEIKGKKGRDESLSAKNKLTDLEASKKRFDPDVVNAFAKALSAESAKQDLERQKGIAKDSLSTYCKDILVTYETTINRILETFNTGFRITGTKSQYTGGTPSSQFQLLINNCTLDLGDERTPEGMPCFKTALSSGDRSALALAFFAAVLELDPQISDKIIAFDDPFTSQDRFRRESTKNLILRLASKAKQVIILSHDAHFLKLLWENGQTRQIGIKTLQLAPVMDMVSVNEWDIDIETRSTHDRNFGILSAYSNNFEGEPIKVARSIRPFLEGHLRSRFPGHFTSNIWLGDFIDVIRNSDDSSSLAPIKAKVDDITEINDYSKKYHHEQNPSADNEPIDKTELQSFTKLTLKFAGG